MVEPVMTIQPSSMLNPKGSSISNYHSHIHSESHSHIQQQVQPTPPSPPEFKLSQYEISCIKLIWNSLNLVNNVSTTTTTNLQNTTRIGLPNSTSSGSLSLNSRKLSISSITSINSITTSVPLMTSTTSQLPIITYNESPYLQFQYDLCTLIFNEDNNTTNQQFDSDDDFINISNDYQILEMINLVCILINYLEFNKILPIGYIIKLSKQNARIYNYNKRKYSMFGECLIKNVLTYINNNGDANEKELLSLENQISLNKFISQFLNLLLHHGTEVILPEFDYTGSSQHIPPTQSQSTSSLLLPPTMPVTVVHSRNSSISRSNTASTTLMDSQSNLTVNSSPSSKVMSETSSQLSLYKSNDMDHDMNNSAVGHNDAEDDDDNATIASSGYVKKSYVKLEEDNVSRYSSINYDDETYDDEDDSFDYLNSFSSSNSGKKKRLSILKKKSSTTSPTSASRNGPNGLSRMNTNTSMTSKYSNMTNSKRIPSQLSTTTTNTTMNTTSTSIATSGKNKSIKGGSDSIYARGNNGSQDNCVIM